MNWQQVDRAALLAHSGNDPYVRWATPAGVIAAAGEHGWACVAPWRPSGHWGGAAIVAPDAPADVESEALEFLAAAAREREVEVEWFSTAAGRELQALSPLTVAGSGRWDFLWTEVPPVEQASAAVDLVELDDSADAARIEVFARSHNPGFEGFPGRGFATLWLGVADDQGDLIAVGSLHELASGAPHLAGIVVHTEHRGRGLGRALTAALTRRAIEAVGVSTLGVYSDNAVALAVYARLGYRTGHRFETRSLVMPERLA
ncbi:GNAT family N-acetyltransferase [Occultella aeris]|uniref:Mycothiol acetyltransferase n=1 Tax=Occultella aeris TaxID=2761496 RepID=A0A7M4DEJ4_9MICO|nr:GNAT family N-acetyltransferase [Occultella aeris]VZO35337.1 Mycothiol acetyltransferase [Occultella aeris]